MAAIRPGYSKNSESSLLLDGPQVVQPLLYVSSQTTMRVAAKEIDNDNRIQKTPKTNPLLYFMTIPFHGYSPNIIKLHWQPNIL
jgi:hypothetical protein